MSKNLELSSIWNFTLPLLVLVDVVIVRNVSIMNAVVSNKEKVVLVLDIGTSFVKIGLFDTEANPKEDYQIKFEHWMTIK